MTLSADPATSWRPAALSAGDGRAEAPDVQTGFDELVLQHERVVYRVCYRMLGERHAAEDAAQETFAAAWRNRMHLGRTVAAWLRQVATNKCLDELRRRKRQPVSCLEALADGAEWRASPAPTPEDAAIAGQLRRDLRAALAELPCQQRLAVVLADVEGLSYVEIARATNASIGTVKSRIHRGRRGLRSLAGAWQSMRADADDGFTHALPPS